jgi:hypothetical protein
MHTPRVRKKSVNWLRRFNQDQHGAGNVVTVFKLIQARCRTYQNLKYATPCPAAPPRPCMHAGKFKWRRQRPQNGQMALSATGTRLPTRPNGNPPHDANHGFPVMVLQYASHGALLYVRAFGMRAKKNSCLLLLFAPQTVGDAQVSLSVFTSSLDPNLLYCNLDAFRACGPFVRHAWLSVTTAA